MKCSFYQFVSGCLWFCVSASVYANIVQYGQRLNEADWKVETSKTNCKITQIIPLFGKAEFTQHYSDKGLQFNLYIIRVPGQTIDAIMTAIPPQWNHESMLSPIAKVKLQASNKTLSLKHKLSMRVISELEDGMFPTLTYKNWMDGFDDIRVSISPINFRDQLPKFLKCIATLPAAPVVVVVKPKAKTKSIVKTKPIKIIKIVELAEPNTVYFGANSATLKTIAKNKLKLIALNIKKDKASKHVILSGYSDDIGNRTQSIAISKQRALNVQSYLEQQGISAKYLFTRYFGRDHAILSNNTAKGRAKNRRVHIDIIKSNLKSER